MRLIYKEGQIVSQGKEKRENKILVYIYFEIKGQDAMLIINS